MEKVRLPIAVAIAAMLLQVTLPSCSNAAGAKPASMHKPSAKAQEKLLTEAITFSVHGQYLQALKIYSSLGQASDVNPMALHMYGRTLSLMKKYSEAAVQYRRALARSPRNFEIMNDLAVALTSSGSLQEAKELLVQATRISPKYVTAYNNLGALLMKLGEYGQAVNVLRSSLSLQPGNKSIQKLLGQAIAKQVDQSGAEHEDWWVDEDWDVLSKSSKQEDSLYLDVDLLTNGSAEGNQAPPPEKPLESEAATIPATTPVQPQEDSWKK